MQKPLGQYTVTDINPLTGEQRYSTLRFDDDGKIFNINPSAITPELRNMLAVSPESAALGLTPLDAYLINSAWQRQAIAPLWEVQTAKLQTNIGDPNAGLTEEERAAKAGLGLNRDGKVFDSLGLISDARTLFTPGIDAQAANEQQWSKAA